MSTCPRCGADFSCCMVVTAQQKTAQQACWCMQVPRLSAQEMSGLATQSNPSRCLCPACLHALTAKPPSIAL
ncbi:MAG: cysteine-rich CWC family protein [Proteobacteria bacterium]|nr:cysteine-rich CWC family protein [Pseudomonadota bacterium]